ncbi:MAG: HAMP domain-containing protein [Phycisphaerales bacterium]|nr:HAMP domain-containing protein [Phycisphaerales bacterium]
MNQFDPSSRRWPLWVRMGVPSAAMLLAAAAGLGWFAASRLRQLKPGPDAEELLRELLTAGALCTLVLTAGMLLLLRRLSRTLGRIEAGASRFAEGRLTHRIVAPEPAELASLVSSLNRMAALLDEQMAGAVTQRGELEAVLQSIDSGVLALDSEGRAISINRAAEVMLAIEGLAVRGRRYQEFVDHPGLLGFLNDVTESDAAPSSREITLAATDGAGEDGRAVESRRPLSVRATAGWLRGPDGARVGTMLFLQDVSQLKRLETMRSDFAANVSHELRTPITNIKGYIETLLDAGMSDPELSEKFLRVVQRNAERLGAIVDDMLALTTLERPELQGSLVTGPTPVLAVVDAARAECEADARAKQIMVDMSIPPGLRFDVNPRLAEQAVFNLLENAVKYSPPRTSVRVKARRVTTDAGGPGVEIAVEDDGPGMAAEHLPRIFERFYRVDKGRSRDQGGTGLGLAIVKHIATAHGGSVAVESAPGRGATFRLVFRGVGSERGEADLAES